MNNFKLNPPPSWPPFPVGWAPGPGWQPGPELPIPLGWQLWIPTEAREEAPEEVDLSEYVDPFAAYLPGSTTINAAAEPVLASKPAFRQRRGRRIPISSLLVGPLVLLAGGWLSWQTYLADGLFHAVAVFVTILAVTAALTGVYKTITGRPTWAQLEGGRGSGVRPVLLGIILFAAVAAAGYFGVDVPAWVPELPIPEFEK